MATTDALRAPSTAGLAVWLATGDDDGVADDGVADGRGLADSPTHTLAAGLLGLEPRPKTKIATSKTAAPASSPAGRAVRVTCGFGAENGR
jgi:hypothetical protein